MKSEGKENETREKILAVLCALVLSVGMFMSQSITSFAADIPFDNDHRTNNFGKIIREGDKLIGVTGTSLNLE